MTDLPDMSPNLGLPFYQTKQNEFEVQHNEALLMLDALVMLAVKDRDLSAPTGSPALGDRYLVKPAGTGAFAGKDNRIAQYDTGGWNFYQPQAGWTCYVQDEQVLLAWDGDSWEPALDVLGGITEIQELSLLGVGTTADATNPLSAKLNNALWAAKTVAEGGDGDLRYKLSKESASKTLSFLFQDNFSGRAEIGLTGDDDFHFKVSADGSAWLDAIEIDRSTGVVTFPQNPPPSIAADLDLTLAELAMGLADALAVGQFLGASGNRFADSFDALTYVNTGAATNLDSGTAGLLKPNTSGGSPVSQQASATVLGTMTYTGGSPAANANNLRDQSNSTAAADGSALNGSTAMGYDFGTALAIRKINTVTATTATWGAGNNWGNTAVFNIQYSDNGSSWTTVTGSVTQHTVSAGNLQSNTTEIDNNGAHRYWRLVYASGTTGGGAWMCQLNMYLAAAANNLAVTSTGLSAASAPTSMKIAAMVKHVDSATAGTDYKFKVSRNGGTNLSSHLTLTDRHTIPGGSIHVIESDAIDVTGITSGTTPCWQFETFNNKMVELQAIYLYWT